MDKKNMIIAAVVISAVGVVGTMVWSEEKAKDGHQEVAAKLDIAMATSAKITIEEAMQIALGNFPGKVIEAELEQTQDKTVWEIDILTADQAIMAVYVDADSGSVRMTEEKLTEKKAAEEKKL